MYRLMVKSRATGKVYSPMCVPGDMIERSDDLWTMVVMQSNFLYSFPGYTPVVVDENGKEIHEYTCYDGTVITF